MIRTLLVIIFGLAVTLTASNLNILAHEGKHQLEVGEHKVVNIIGNIAGEESNKVKLQCPVTKDWFVPDEKSPKTVYKEKTYYFCCPGCKPQFDKAPEKYVKG